MSFLKSLFGVAKDANNNGEEVPDNTRLRYLMDIWTEDRSNANYAAVVTEIVEGNSFLLLPSINDGSDSVEWEKAGIGKTLKLSSIFNLDGLKVLGAFSDEKALVEWAKGPCQYTGMRSRELVELCKINGIDRIVINSGQKNMFVLERNRESIQTLTIDESSEVLVGTPSKSLSSDIIDKLIFNFKKVDTIEEAYQYMMSSNNGTGITLGIKMSIVSDNSMAALQNALANSLKDEKPDMPLDVIILETEDWLATVRRIENALFYKR